MVEVRRMKAAMLYGVGDLRVEEIPIPEVGEGEMLVKVGAATTCGTDLKIFRRGYVSGVISYPTVFGHEWAGTVVEVGEGVEKFKPGDRVRAGNSAPCLKCPMCREGKYNLCENRTWLWGAYAEYIKVPKPIVELNAQKVPEHLSFEEAAVAEPLACVLHGADRTGFRGGTVAIIGSGPIGLLHLQVALLRGADMVVVCDLSEERLRYAERLGASAVVNVREEDPVEAVRKLTGGLGVDLAIEAVGTPATWVQAFKMAKKGGVVLEFGGCPPGAEVCFEAAPIHYGEVSVVGSFHASPRDFERALRLIASGDVRVKPLITDRLPLERIREAFKRLIESRRELKIAIIP